MDLCKITKVDYIRDLYNNDVTLIVLNDLGKKDMKNILGFDVEINLFDVWEFCMN